MSGKYKVSDLIKKLKKIYIYDKSSFQMGDLEDIESFGYIYYLEKGGII